MDRAAKRHRRSFGYFPTSLVILGILLVGLASIAVSVSDIPQRDEEPLQGFLPHAGAFAPYSDCRQPSDGFMAYNPGFKGGVFVASGDVDGDGCDELITGADAGGGPHVIIWDNILSSFKVKVSFFAYNSSFKGGVRVAAGDVDGDGFDEVITGAGPGGGPHVRVFDIVGGSAVPHPGGSFFAYNGTFRGGVFVGAGDVTAGVAEEIITGAGKGGGPHVRVFDKNGAQAAGGSFFAADPNFKGGVTVAAGDFDGGKQEIVTGKGPGGDSEVTLFKLVGGSAGKMFGFQAYNSSFKGGIFVAAGERVAFNVGDEIVTGAGPGGGPHVRVFDATGGDLAGGGFFAYNSGFKGGVRVAVGDTEGDLHSEVVTGAGPGGGPHVRLFE